MTALHLLISVVAHALQVVAKHDTVFVLDTVRVLEREGGISLAAWLGLILTSIGLAGAGGWRLRGVRIGRQHAHLRINAEAFSLRRELQASIGSGPAKDQAS